MRRLSEPTITVLLSNPLRQGLGATLDRESHAHLSNISLDLRYDNRSREHFTPGAFDRA